MSDPGGNSRNLDMRNHVLPVGAVVAAIATALLVWFNIEDLVEGRIQMHLKPIEERLSRHEAKDYHDRLPAYVDARLNAVAETNRQDMTELKAMVQELRKEMQLVRESMARLEGGTH